VPNALSTALNPAGSTQIKRYWVDALGSGFLATFALLLFVYRLGWPDWYVWDEVYHAYTAGQYVAGNSDAFVWGTTPAGPGSMYTWNHPPLGLHLIGFGIRAWGDDPLGWRLPGAIFGAAGVGIAYLMGGVAGPE